MDHKVGLAALLKFARTEFSEEQLLFWIDVKKMKRCLADTTLWPSHGAEGGSDAATAGSMAHASSNTRSGSGRERGGGSGAPNLFGGLELLADRTPCRPADADQRGDNSNMFDGDFSSHSAGSLEVEESIFTRESPPEAATGDRAAFLQRRCAEIIDTYLANGADFQCTMPDHKYKSKSASASPPYAFEEGMFDTFSELAYKQVKNETFMRFRVTEAAHELATRQPHLVAELDDKSCGAVAARVVAVGQEASNMASNLDTHRHPGRI